MRDAYRVTFPKGCAADSEPFWKDANVRAASALRNVIVHNAGVVDNDFKEKRGAHLNLSHYDLNDQIVLDGELLQSLLQGLINFARTLIQAVDVWIVANP
jgi:hypothetical protein